MDIKQMERDLDNLDPVPGLRRTVVDAEFNDGVKEKLVAWADDNYPGIVILAIPLRNKKGYNLNLTHAPTGLRIVDLNVGNRVSTGDIKAGQKANTRLRRAHETLKLFGEGLNWDRDADELLSDTETIDKVRELVAKGCHVVR